MPVRLVARWSADLPNKENERLTSSLGGQRSLAPQKALGRLLCLAKSLFKCRMV